MILFVKDNAKILFLKKVRVEVQDPITPPIQRPDQSGKRGTQFIYEEDYDFEGRAKELKLKKEEEEIILITKIFVKTCL